VVRGGENCDIELKNKGEKERDSEKNTTETINITK